MSTAVIQNLEKLVDGPRDGALLRYALGNEWLKAGDPAQAAASLSQAVELDPGYSAAWKLLGKALTQAGDASAALQAYHQGLAVAETRGDMQAAKEMRVFIRRLEQQGA